MKTVIVAVGVSSALLFTGCDLEGADDARRPATTPSAERRAAGRRELRAELEWLLAPEPTCPRPRPAVPLPDEEPVATMLEILGLAPTQDPSRCPVGDLRP